MAAPAITSVTQCLLFSTLDTPVRAATVYPPMLNHWLLQPYSLCSIAAVMNAVAVCPDGNEFLAEPSGLGLLTEYFSPLTSPAMIAPEKASETSILPHEVRPSYPAAFSPTRTTAGTYCDQSSTL